MTLSAEIRIDDSRADEGVRSGVLSSPGVPEKVLTFRSFDGPLPIEAGADPFLLGSLLHFMSLGHDLHIHGAVTARLLRGVEELQGIWSLWCPGTHRKIRITCDDVVPGFPIDGPAISAFSGGVDATFTVQRHALGLAGADRADLQAALMVHGFDIHRDDGDTYLAARERARLQLADTDLELRGVWTDLRALNQDWEHVFGLAVAACLTLHQPRFSVGLIGSSERYDSWQVVPWGSSPITDHLFSTGFMDIRHDGAIASRTEKVQSIADWPEAVRHLRVCWEGEQQDRNCGRCEKCVRTYLNFQAVGHPDPGCFDRLPTVQDIHTMRARNLRQLAELISIASHARAHNQDGPWLTALDAAIKSNSRRLAVDQSLPIRVMRRLAWERNKVLRKGRSAAAMMRRPSAEGERT